MIPFYVVSALWLLTVIAWQFREQAQGRERMEMLKLFRAQSLTDYNVQKEKGGSKPTNFIQASLKRAYDDMLGDDDD